MRELIEMFLKAQFPACVWCKSLLCVGKETFSVRLGLVFTNDDLPFALGEEAQ